MRAPLIKKRIKRIPDILHRNAMVGIVLFKELQNVSIAIEMTADVCRRRRTEMELASFDRDSEEQLNIRKI